MTTDASIVVDHVTKRYHRRGQLKGLRETLASLPRRILSGKQQADDLLDAVQDVSFQVQPGEAFGIIGPNGAGKTTMLRLLSGITQPTSGRIAAPGRIASIIELGAGFHPELSGRENIHLYAAIMGLRPREVKAGFDEIVAFSELEPFLDMALKHYSSGMYVRLAFSVATFSRPDVLLVDEVLAVGDAAFQSKSLRRIRELKDSGTAIVFVSHSMHAVRILCDRAALLHRGRVQIESGAEAVIAEYLNNPHYTDSGESTSYQTGAEGKGPARARAAEITRVAIVDVSGQEKSAFKTGERLLVRIEYLARERIVRPVFSIAFYSTDGTLYAAHETDWDNFDVDAIEGRGAIEALFDKLTLLPGGYLLSISISDSTGLSKYDWHQKAYRLHVLVGDRASGLMYLSHAWRMSACMPGPIEGYTTRVGQPADLSNG